MPVFSSLIQMNDMIFLVSISDKGHGKWLRVTGQTKFSRDRPCK